MNEHDLQLLEGAIRNILYVIERHNVADEDARERVKEFRLFVNDSAPQRENDVERELDVEKKENDVAPMHVVENLSSVVKFSEKEITQMAETFKREFIGNGLAAHVIKKPSGKKTFCYEIRYRRNGYNIVASSTNLVEAKRKFLQKTLPGEIEKYKINKQPTGFSELQEIFDEWIEYKRGSVLEKELQRFQADFDSLPIKLKKMHVENIRTVDISRVMKELAPRKYEQMRTVFNGIFKYAIASGVISHNPMGLIPFRRAERVAREALTKAELFAFFGRICAEEYAPIRQGAYLLYFFGLRPCEVDESTHREGDFLIARNRKRKNGKIEYKKIPIPKQAEDLIDWSAPLTFGCSAWMRNKLFNAALGNGNKTAYCLRHTFCTLCQEKVRQEIVEIWMGDSPQRLVGKIYTHFSDEFMRSQMDLITFPTLETP